jgi:hypothetical protein
VTRLLSVGVCVLLLERDFFEDRVRKAPPPREFVRDLVLVEMENALDLVLLLEQVVAREHEREAPEGSNGPEHSGELLRGDSGEDVPVDRAVLRDGFPDVVSVAHGGNSFSDAFPYESIVSARRTADKRRTGRPDPGVVICYGT